jgi:DNA-binding MarR family transcriptional regulator
MWSNVLRFLDGKSVALRDLPKHSGLSKPATNIAVACLQRHGWIEVESGENRTRTVRLTPRGRSLLDVASDVAGDIDRKWRERFGAGAIDELLAALQRVTEEAPSLPWYPMALPNRGGTPTGA